MDITHNQLLDMIQKTKEKAYLEKVGRLTFLIHDNFCQDDHTWTEDGKQIGKHPCDWGRYLSKKEKRCRVVAEKLLNKMSEKEAEYIVDMLFMTL